MFKQIQYLNSKLIDFKLLSYLALKLIANCEHILKNRLGSSLHRYCSRPDHRCHHRFQILEKGGKGANVNFIQSNHRIYLFISKQKLKQILNATDSWGPGVVEFRENWFKQKQRDCRSSPGFENTAMNFNE